MTVELPMAQPEKKEEEEEKSQARLDYEEGVAFLERGEAAQAANMLHNALIGFEQDEDFNGVANATTKLADICVERGDYETALKHYNKVTDYCLDRGDNISVFELDKKKARLYARWGKLETAIESYLDILEQYNAMRNPKGAVDTFEKLAQVYIDNGKKEQAADCYRTAASILQNYKHEIEAQSYMKKAEALLAD